MGVVELATLAATAFAANQQRKAAGEASDAARDARQQMVDPRELIRLQAEMNRVGATNPWGSSQYRQTPSGGWEVVSEYGPGLQQLQQRMLGLANTDSTRYQLPQQFGGLQDAMFARAMQGVGNGTTSGRDWALSRINSPAPPMSWGPRPQGGSAKPPNAMPMQQVSQQIQGFPFFGGGG